MIIISSNHFSVDDQTADALSYLSLSDDPELAKLSDQFSAEFPEYNTLVWSGSWVDTEASNVDVEYMDWVRDWIEAHTPIHWYDGEPIIDEEGDEPDEYGEIPDSYLDPIDGHWYVCRYDRTAPQIHAQDCEHPNHQETER